MEDLIVFPPIFCLTNNPSKSTIQEEFKREGVVQDVITYIDFISEESSTVDYYTHDLDLKENIRREASYYASHIKAIRALLRSKADKGIICESGIRLNNSFLGNYVKILASLSKEVEAVSLCPKNKTCMYLLSRNYAARIIALYDKLLERIPHEYRNIESILSEAKGWKETYDLSYKVSLNLTYCKNPYKPIVLDL